MTLGTYALMASANVMQDPRSDTLVTLTHSYSVSHKVRNRVTISPM